MGIRVSKNIAMSTENRFDSCLFLLFHLFKCNFIYLLIFRIFRCTITNAPAIGSATDDLNCFPINCNAFVHIL